MFQQKYTSEALLENPLFFTSPLVQYILSVALLSFSLTISITNMRNIIFHIMLDVNIHHWSIQSIFHPLVILLRMSDGSKSSRLSSTTTQLSLSNGQSPISRGKDSRRFPLSSKRTSWAKLATLELR